MDLSIIQDSEEKYSPTNAPGRKGHHDNTALRLTYSKRCDFVNFCLQFVLCLDRALNKLYKYFRFRPGLFPSLIPFSSDSSGGSIRDILVSLRWYFTKTNCHRTVLFGRETNVILWNDLSCLKTSPLVRAARSARVQRKVKDKELRSIYIALFSNERNNLVHETDWLFSAVYHAMKMSTPLIGHRQVYDRFLIRVGRST